jgi:hypothetical protein
VQTTLRIDDRIYRKAKDKAAREGITMNKLVEEALELRLQQPPSSTTSSTLPVFRGGPSLPPNFDLVEAIKKSESEADLLLADKLITARKRSGRKSR